MTSERELDRLLGAYFDDGRDELADRVIDAALDQIDHTKQRRVLRVPWRFPTMFTPVRLGAAALIGVLALGGMMLVFSGGSRPSVTVPTPTSTPVVTPAPSAPARVRVAGHRQPRARPRERRTGGPASRWARPAHRRDRPQPLSRSATWSCTTRRPGPGDRPAAWPRHACTRRPPSWRTARCSSPAVRRARAQPPRPSSTTRPREHGRPPAS